ncbi:DUF6438 domain-containing protein [Hymenobacter properus]|uniref:DUF6438 domain-containing protein n=1 Tax=Hymenobacter properus TaxID=2791026 RepID=A0A931BF31_9BACT|nr:DUF6438 domain-containing protein [Hymenobacter properus]MBF9142249.1 hypothetical protein [Hymenobacter properus]MBR7721056.1 hypothetical protein [Microvirga sp. SRT04]
MRYIPLLLLLSFFSLSVPACAQKTTVQKTKTKKASKKATPTEAGPVLTFERTPCFGTCPAYTMQVYADGRVAYEGRHNVPLIGKKELKLPAAVVADMLRQAKEAHFETFATQYRSGVTDMPSTIVAIRQPDGSFKKVTAESAVPENVQAYFTYLTTQFDRLGQVNGLESDK